jgi:hypothetical protein
MASQHILTIENMDGQEMGTQIDRWTDTDAEEIHRRVTQTDTQIDEKTDKWGGYGRCIEMDRQTEEQTDRQKNKQTNTEEQTDKHRRTNRQTQKNKQTDWWIDIRVCGVYNRPGRETDRWMK